MVIFLSPCNPEETFWYAPMLSIGITFFGGLLIILLARLIRRLCKRSKRNSKPPEMGQNSEIVEFEEGGKVQMNCYRKIQDWSSTLISGTSKLGTALVIGFCNFLLLF